MTASRFRSRTPLTVGTVHRPDRNGSIVFLHSSAVARRRLGRIALLIVAAALAAVVGLLCWVGVRGFVAYQHLSSIEQKLATTNISGLVDGTAASALLEELADEASSARDLTSDTGWSVAERLPWIGPHLTALSVTADSADGLLVSALLPLAAELQQTPLESLKPRAGKIDANALSNLVDPATRAADAATRAAASMRAIDRTPLAGAVSSRVGEVTELFSRTAGGLEALARAAQLLPRMLGGDSPKRYLVLVQNNAEWRSLGGIAGTAVVIEAAGGQLSLLETASGTALSAALRGPVADLPTDVQNIYGQKPARFFQNLTQVPDFTFDGPLARDMYAKVTGTSVDGVIAIDPVALSYLLRATGPVALPDGSKIDEDNAVPLLLSEVYDKYPSPSQQDEFFAGSTAAIFHKFLADPGSTDKLLAALSRAADEHRVLVWSSDTETQGVLASSSLSGRLPESTRDAVELGVYLNDSGGSKMSYYVTPDVRATWGACATSDTPGIRQLTLDVELKNNAPEDAGSTLPTYVTANGAFGVTPGNAATVVNVYLPPGWEVSSATNSAPTGSARAAYGEHQVVSFSVNLAPRATASLQVSVRSRAQVDFAKVYVTPTADARVRPVVSASCTPSSSTSLY